MLCVGEPSAFMLYWLLLSDLNSAVRHLNRFGPVEFSVFRLRGQLVGSPH